MKIKLIKDILRYSMDNVGLKEYKLKLIPGYHEIDGDYAEVDIFLYERYMEVKLGLKFKKSKYEDQVDTLVHEAVHGRIELFNKQKLSAIEDIEENLAIDLTRGLEQLVAKKWPQEKD